MKVLKQGDIYAPEHLGRKDILIEGSRIARIADHIDEYDQIEEVEKVDLGGHILTPGYMDIHVHITGGGGESGPATRVPEASLSVLVRNGITTVVGLLGTDGITRSLENLLAKARAFNEEGITCRILTGAYGYPSPTITGSVERDIALIPRVYQVADYLQKKNLKLDALVGYDLLQKNVEHLKNGEVNYLIGQRPGLQGYCGIKALCNHVVFKKPVTAVKYMPIDILMKENIDFYFEFE